MKVKSSQLAILVFVIIFGSVGITSALDIWKTTSSKTPAKYTEGEFAGEADPADIRGSYTFEEISKNFDLPIEDLGAAFGLQNEPNYASIQVKQLKEDYADLAPEGKEIDTASVRYFVALYKGLPFTLTEETYLPESAVNILKEKASLTPEQLLKINE